MSEDGMIESLLNGLGTPSFSPANFLPVYTPMESGRWVMSNAANVLCSGYWNETFIVGKMAALLRRAKDGLETWMSLTPFEIESQELGCHHAFGRTVVMGLGMGWAAGETALNPNVTRVDVVELDPDVLAVAEAQGTFRQLPPEAAAKVHLHNASALDWVPDEPVDTLLADIWLPLNGDERVEEVRRMRANTGASRVYFWGQEMVIARRARDTGRALDAASVGDIVRELDLPLIGPDEEPDYPAMIAKAARRRLQDPV